jgi:hypothetical protein
MIKEQEPKQDDEVSTRAPPSDELIQELVSPIQQSEDEVSCFPLQNSDDTVFLDSEDEGEKKALNEVDGPCCATSRLLLHVPLLRNIFQPLKERYRA